MLPVSLRCGCLREHSLQVPAVFADLWMVPLYSSSTEWWILPLCYRDRYAQCRTVHVGLVVNMPVIVHNKVVDNTVVAQRPFPLVQPSRPLRFPSCSPLIWCSTSRCAGPAVSSKAVCEKTVEIPQLHHVEIIAAWTLLLHARCVQRQIPGGSECRKVRGSRSCSTLTGSRCPRHAGLRYGRCCDHAVTSVSRTVKVPQTHPGVGGHFRSQQRRARFQLGVAALRGPFFALLQVVWSRAPVFELSSTHTCECSRAPCQLDRAVVLTNDMARFVNLRQKQQQQKQKKQHNNTTPQQSPTTTNNHAKYPFYGGFFGNSKVSYIVLVSISVIVSMCG